MNRSFNYDDDASSRHADFIELLKVGNDYIREHRLRRSSIIYLLHNTKEIL